MSVSIFIFLILIESIDEFKDQKLPLARIKKIMKSDEDVRVNFYLHSPI